jgi:Skp family chaperone for outer membrane proteins
VKKKVLWAVGALALGASVIVGSTLWAKQGAGTTPTAPAAQPPKVKIAFINLAYVLKNYKKIEALNEDFKKIYQQYEAMAKPMQKQIEDLMAENKKPETATDKRSANEKTITKLKRDIEDLNIKAREALAPKTEATTIAIYKEIQESAIKTAVANGFELVLQFQDGSTPEDYNSPMNIMNKMQTRACIPMWYQPGNDISYQVVTTLNETYAQAGAPAPGTGATPSGH